MARGLNRISASAMANARSPGDRLGDGGGLWLVVTKQGTRNWVFVSIRDGKRREVGLGSVLSVTLADARLKAAELRSAVDRGEDPHDARDRLRIANQPGVTFRDAAAQFYADRRAGWRSKAHAYQWTRSLELHAHPVIGDISVAALTVADVLRVLQRNNLWEKRTETASRVQSRIAEVINYATVKGLRPGTDNPADWDRLKYILPAPAKLKTVVHHAALDHEHIPALTKALTAQPGMSALALRFLALTGARTSEVTGATLAEIDMENAVWVIPGARMKAGKEHRVALSPAALAIVKALPKRKYLFGVRRDKPLSQMAMAVSLRRVLGLAGLPHASVHGLRATFRTWAADRTNTAREVIETSLAHTVGSVVERAYQRSDLLDQRRVLMNRWADYCLGVEASNVVVPMRAAG
jgi:integrase